MELKDTVDLMCSAHHENRLIAEYRQTLRGILENTTVVRPDGTREKLKKKERS